MRFSHDGHRLISVSADGYGGGGGGREGRDGEGRGGMGRGGEGRGGEREGGREGGSGHSATRRERPLAAVMFSLCLLFSRHQDSSLSLFPALCSLSIQLPATFVCPLPPPLPSSLYAPLSRALPPMTGVSSSGVFPPSSRSCRRTVTLSLTDGHRSSGASVTRSGVRAAVSGSGRRYRGRVGSGQRYRGHVDVTDRLNQFVPLHLGSYH